MLFLLRNPMMEQKIKLIETNNPGCVGCIYDTLDGCGNEDQYSCITESNQLPNAEEAANFIFIEDGEIADGS